MALLKYNNNSLFSDLIYFLVLDGFLFFLDGFLKLAQRSLKLAP